MEEIVRDTKHIETIPLTYLLFTKFLTVTEKSHHTLGKSNPAIGHWKTIDKSTPTTKQTLYFLSHFQILMRAKLRELAKTQIWQKKPKNFWIWKGDEKEKGKRKFKRQRFMIFKERCEFFCGIINMKIFRYFLMIHNFDCEGGLKKYFDLLDVFSFRWD